MTIFKRLFRVYAHIYFSHYDKISQSGADDLLNTAFKHFYLFIEEFNLVNSKEMAPLQSLIDNINHRSKDSSDRVNNLKEKEIPYESQNTTAVNEVKTPDMDPMMEREDDNNSQNNTEEDEPNIEDDQEKTTQTNLKQKVLSFIPFSSLDRTRNCFLSRNRMPKNSRMMKLW